MSINLPKRKQEEIERIAFFSGVDSSRFSDEDILNYFDHSEKGIGQGNRISVFKQRQGMTLREWEQSMLKQDGSWPGYHRIIRDEKGGLLPNHIIDFIKKEMFKGIDERSIDECVNENSPVQATS